MAGKYFKSLAEGMIIPVLIGCTACNTDRTPGKKDFISEAITGTVKVQETYGGDEKVNTLLVLPKSPAPGEEFSILAVGGESIRKARIKIVGPSGELKSHKSKTGNESPFWHIDYFNGSQAGKYKVVLEAGRKEATLEFNIGQADRATQPGVIWKTTRGWDAGTEELYSAWINALFAGCDEQSIWKALHEVTENKDQNFLYNYLSLNEDDPHGKNSVVMQPDCADNPFFLRAYFSWKLGLPFGFHICDRGSLSRNPTAGQWITNESGTSKGNPVQAFNIFLRRVMDGVQSGTARTALDDKNSDYYPVPLERKALRPGTVYADPYGHTLILVGWMPQSNGHPGLLLAVDAQPDGTVGIKRFWKGNFLFNTSGVVGEPGFKAFRPVSIKGNSLYPVQNRELTQSSGYIPFSMQQKKMDDKAFYHTMERLINPEPLDPETALLDLIQALHEQVMVRVTSVSNGEAYFRSHPGNIIPMPLSATGIFQTGGEWEDFSTPNRDLRLLIAMDAVLDFPDRIVESPGDYKISAAASPEHIRKKLLTLLDQKTSELSITYTRTDGSLQKLTLADLLKRRDAFEMAYNPNDGVEIRWGAPENSSERSTCKRHVPPRQMEAMRSIRPWFHKRLHPPT